VQKFILGIHGWCNHDAGACILKHDNAKILDKVAIAEERLVRRKHPYAFPSLSIKYCMDYFELSSLDDLDLIVTDYSQFRRWNRSSESYNATEFDYLRKNLSIKDEKVRFVNHHLAHASNAFYPSPHEEAAILVVDGVGSNLETTSFFYGKNGKIRLVEKSRFFGIGYLYNSITNYVLNLGGIGGEGKTMGLAPFGQAHGRVLDFGGEYSGACVDYSDFMRRLPASNILATKSKYDTSPFLEKIDVCTNKKDLLSPYFSRIAYDLQEEAERACIHLAKELYEKTGSKNLCVSGGVGLNSVANKKIYDACNYKNIFVFPACTDEGIPYGLALYGFYNLSELSKPPAKQAIGNAYFGKDYSGDEISALLDRLRLKSRVMDLNSVAQQIAQGKIIGWFQGRSEYGPRALGNRSILADSRNAGMKDKINLTIKHRETFRPFAPSILAEHAVEYFDLDIESPYMLLVADCVKPDQVPSVVHVDNTARVQTVTEAQNSRFYGLIKAFYELTGVPCLLNTSFNDAGEPIVETPEDAIIRFLECGIDSLVIQDRLLLLSDFPQSHRERICKKMKEQRDQKISKNYTYFREKFLYRYDEDEKNQYISDCNFISEWNVKYKYKNSVERFVNKCVTENRSIILIGEIEHTKVLRKEINQFTLLTILGFIEFPFSQKGKETHEPYRTLQIEDLDKFTFDHVFVSSYEYNFKIIEYLIGQEKGEKVKSFYDYASVSIERFVT
jgi:carbamoyltransferase